MLSSTTLERRVLGQAWKTSLLGPGQEMNGTERNEKRKQTKLIDELQAPNGAVGGVHRRATGADAAWAAHPGQDHRPRPSATTGYPA